MLFHHSVSDGLLIRHSRLKHHARLLRFVTKNEIVKVVPLPALPANDIGMIEKQLISALSQTSHRANVG